MTHDRDDALEALLAWRLKRAADSAPPAPHLGAMRLLALPWWERAPEQFRVRAARLQRMPATSGFAHTSGDPSRRGFPVPALIMAGADIDTHAQILYVAFRDGRLRVRFALETPPSETSGVLESTFVAEASAEPLFTCLAERSPSGDYRVDVALPSALAAAWASLKVTDHMPFRLILRPLGDATSANDATAGSD